MTTPQNQGEVPQYRVLRDSFYAPRVVKAGSIIQTWGSPGDHLEPLNETAVAKMEEWYNEEHPTLDRDGKPNFDKMYKPHERFRIKTYAAAEVHEMVLLAEPKPDDMTGTVSLAEIAQQAGRQNTDQRPAAQATPAVVPTAEALALEEQPVSETLVVAPAPADPKLANLKVK